MNRIKTGMIRIFVLAALMMAIIPELSGFASSSNGVLIADVYDVLPDGTALLPSWGVKSDDLLSGVSVENGLLTVSNEETTEAVKVSTFSIHSDGVARNSGSNLNPLEALIEFNVRKSSYATTYFEQVATNSSALYRISFEDKGVVRVHNCRTTDGKPGANYVSQEGTYRINEFFNVKIETRPNDAKFSVYINDVPIVENASHKTLSVKTTRWLRFGIDAREKDESKIVRFELADFFMRGIQRSGTLDDANAVSAAAELLTYSRLLAANTDKNNVTTNLTLLDGMSISSPVPTGGNPTEDVTIRWESDNIDVINPVTGGVTRPTDGNPDALVTLTATIQKGEEAITKAFPFTVAQITNEAYEVAAAIHVMGSVGKETSKLDLPTSDPAGIHHAQITWQSDSPSVIAADGTVLSTAQETVVTLTATVLVEGFDAIVRSFKVHVIPDASQENILKGCTASTNGLVVYNLPSNAVDADITTHWKSAIKEGSTLTITFKEAKLVEKIILRELSQGVQSFRIDVLHNNNWQPVYTGNRGETGSAIIPCTVIQGTAIRLSIVQASGEVALAEIEAYGNADTEQDAKKDAQSLTLGDTSDVKTDIPLPHTGERGSDISWASSNTAVIKIENDVARVTRPESSSSKKVSVTLTAQITKDGHTETKQFTIQVAPIVVSSPLGGKGGGRTSGRTSGSNSVPIVVPALPVPIESKPAKEPEPILARLPFVDVAKDGWEYPYIQCLYDKGIITGVSETLFEPDRNITREEFVAIVVKALDITEKSTEKSDTQVFADVAVGQWYTPFIAAAYEQGIIRGMTSTTFGVGSNVTRQEMAVIICRAAAYKGINLGAQNMGSAFSDDEAISGWAKDAVATLHAANIIEGIDGAFCPGDTATRAQSAKMVCALLKGTK